MSELEEFKFEPKPLQMRGDSPVTALNGSGFFPQTANKSMGGNITSMSDSGTF